PHALVHRGRDRRRALGARGARTGRRSRCGRHPGVGDAPRVPRAKVAMTRPAPTGLDAIFRPRSVAVIGASRRPGSIGAAIFRNLLANGFEGPVYPVNPSARVVQSVLAYPSVADIPGEVDLAVIVVPARQALEAVEECGRKGVRGV